MAGDLAARFRRAERMPPVIRSHHVGPRQGAAAREIAELILAWDRESDDPDDRYRVVDCKDASEACRLYQVCANVSHSRPVNIETKYVYDACKRGLQVFLVRKYLRRSRLHELTKEREQ